MTDPGGDCLWCGTVFPTGRGLLAHTNGPCTETDPRPPRNTPGRRMECGTCTIRHTPRCQTGTWPVEPLLMLVGGTVGDLGTALGMNRGKIRSAIVAGLDDFKADRWAVRCGFHPASVWPGWLDAGLTVRDADYVANGWRPAYEWNQTRARPETEAAA